MYIGEGILYSDGIGGDGEVHLLGHIAHVHLSAGEHACVDPRLLFVHEEAAREHQVLFVVATIDFKQVIARTGGAHAHIGYHEFVVDERL